jgi:nucleoid DNA-binding protein
VRRGWHKTRTICWHKPGTTHKTIHKSKPRKSIPMNKAELVEAVQKSLASSKADAERAAAAVIDAIKSGLKKGKPVQLIGFGTFKVVSRKARLGINPKTGEKIKIKASKTVKFSVGKDLKSKLK